MKIDDFKDTQATAPVASEIESYTSLTPSGIEVLYSPSPKRLYKVRSPKRNDGSHNYDWFEVPSVTTALDVIDSSGPLIWWGQGIGGIGTLKLQDRGETFDDVRELIRAGDDDAARQALCDKLTVNKISTNHVRKKAADRGQSVHRVFETWCEDQSFRPNVDIYPANEQGFLVGLTQFLDDISLGEPEDIQSEVMVGSVEHRFAGRYDVRYTLRKDVEIVTRTYPVRKPKREVIPAGRWLKDVKTSKGVYEIHPPQLAAYELASVECGYGPTDYQGVIHLKADGRYEFVRTHATAEDFLSILQAYQTMSRAKGWL